jgi:hypothetical protein
MGESGQQATMDQLALNITENVYVPSNSILFTIKPFSEK